MLDSWCVSKPGITPPKRFAGSCGCISLPSEFRTSWWMVVKRGPDYSNTTSHNPIMLLPSFNHSLSKDQSLLPTIRLLLIGCQKKGRCLPLVCFWVRNLNPGLERTAKTRLAEHSVSSVLQRGRMRNDELVPSPHRYSHLIA